MDTVDGVGGLHPVGLNGGLHLELFKRLAILNCTQAQAGRQAGRQALNIGRPATPTPVKT